MQRKCLNNDTFASLFWRNLVTLRLRTYTSIYTYLKSQCLACCSNTYTNVRIIIFITVQALLPLLTLLREGRLLVWNINIIINNVQTKDTCSILINNLIFHSPQRRKWQGRCIANWCLTTWSFMSPMRYFRLYHKSRTLNNLNTI